MNLEGGPFKLTGSGGNRHATYTINKIMYKINTSPCNSRWRSIG